MEAARQLKLLELQEVNGKIAQAERLLATASYNLDYLKRLRARLLQELRPMP